MRKKIRIGYNACIMDFLDCKLDEEKKEGTKFQSSSDRMIRFKLIITRNYSKTKIVEKRI